MTKMGEQIDIDMENFLCVEIHNDSHEDNADFSQLMEIDSSPLKGKCLD